MLLDTVKKKKKKVEDAISGTKKRKQGDGKAKRTTLMMQRHSACAEQLFPLRTDCIHFHAYGGSTLPEMHEFKNKQSFWG